MRKIVQFSATTGELINKWNSIVEASRETKTHKDNIGAVLKKRHKTANGFVWMYQDEYDKRIAIFK